MYILYMCVYVWLWWCVYMSTYPHALLAYTSQMSMNAIKHPASSIIPNGNTKTIDFIDPANEMFLFSCLYTPTIKTQCSLIYNNYKKKLCMYQWSQVYGVIISRITEQFRLRTSFNRCSVCQEGTYQNKHLYLNHYSRYNRCTRPFNNQKGAGCIHLQTLVTWCFHTVISC